MCLVCGAKTSGANVLPFGLMTDVSAGALAAGTGALPGVGKPPGAPVGKSEFETELSAFADVTANGVPGAQESAEFTGGEFPPAFASLFNPGAAEFDPAAGGDLPEAAGAAPGPDPEAGGAADGGVGAPLPAGAAAPFPEPFVPPAGNEAGGSDAAPSGLPDTLGPPPAQTAPTPPQPIRASDVLSSPPETRPADASPQPLRPVPPVQSGVNGPAGGQQAGPAASPQGAAPVPLTQQGQGPAPATPELVTPVPVTPVPATPAAGVPAQDAIAPERGAVANTPQRAEAVRRPAQDEMFAFQSRPAQRAVPDPAAQQLASGRRWQVELPSELRAPVPAFQRTAETVPPLQTPAALPPAGGTTPPSAVSSAAAGGSVQTLTPPAGLPAQPLVAPGTAAAGTQAVSPQPVDGADPLTVSAGGNPGAASVAAPLTPGARQASQNAGTASLTTQVAAEPSPETEPDGFEPVSLKVEAAAKDNKAPAPGSASETQTAGQGAQPGAHSGPQPAANAADARPQAGPLAAAVLATQLPLDDPEAVTKPVELTTAGDFIATVRGGETQGAVRTESLQTPNQAQSGQVATQVAAEIARNLKNGQTRFQMRFDPPELGRVDVNMRVGADGGVHAHLIVERPETLDMFLRDQRGLERALEAAGLNADSENLQFSLKQDGDRGLASGDGQGEQPADAAEGAAGPESDELDAETEEVIRLTLAESRGGLDVKI